MNNYRKASEMIRIPEEMNKRVLEAAEERGRKRSRRRRTYLRRVVCAACALALMLGTFSLRWESGNTPGSSSGEHPGSSLDFMPGNLVLSYEFGIVASAVEKAVNGGLIFRWEDGQCGFHVAGGDIAMVTLETDRGVLLRNGETVSGSITESYDPETFYGIAPADGQTLESLDGVALVLTVHFPDGTSRTETYHLSAEDLRAFINEDGQEVLVPALAGDNSGTVPALYASGAESRWLIWPVVGSNTVSLSMPYGSRSIAGGTTRFHAGIDIPGESGSEITAAASGTVIESGYDAGYGNYLILDHGDGLTTLYGQCQEVLVMNGDQVEQGAVVALLGTTGMSTGPHLHFEVCQNGEAQNPVAYFNREIRATLQAE